MKGLRLLLSASLSLSITVLAGGVHAAPTTNFTDQWSVANEPGWGASVQQQSNTLLVNLLVYGADSKPTWFIVAASLQTNSPQGHTVFSGDLYTATGPHWGWGAFDSSSVIPRKVGTLMFDATTASNATMSYTVDGTPVVKNVTRQTWAYENLSGSYYGGWGGDRSGCAMEPINTVTHFEDLLGMTVTHTADNVVTFTLQYADGGTESFSGTYAQSGHLGRIEGLFIPDGAGSISVSDIEITRSGFTARFTGDLITAHWHDWCDMKNGYITAVRR